MSAPDVFGVLREEHQTHMCAPGSGCSIPPDGSSVTPDSSLDRGSRDRVGEGQKAPDVFGGVPGITPDVQSPAVSNI